METIDIKAEARSQVGKGSARAARRAGLVPAVIYGNKETAIPITITKAARILLNVIRSARKK